MSEHKTICTLCRYARKPVLDQSELQGVDLEEGVLATLLPSQAGIIRSAQASASEQELTHGPPVASLGSFR